MSSLGITKGVFVSTGGFTVDAESHANALKIELWDTKTLEGKITKSEIPQTGIIHDAIPINPTTITTLRPQHLRNASLLSEAISISYYPYYFVDYHCFSQHTVRGISEANSENLKLTLQNNAVAALSSLLSLD